MKEENMKESTGEEVDSIPEVQQNSKHSFVSPFTEITENEEATISSVKMPFPPGTYEMTAQFKEVLSGINKEAYSKMDDETLRHIETIAQATELFYPTSLFTEICKEPLKNRVQYANKNIGIGPSAINTKKPATSKEGVSRFLAIAKQVETVDIVLYHSGFRITLQAPTLLSIVQLIKKITESVIKAGRDTNTILFSNYSAITNTIVAGFIIDHLQSATINIPANSDKELAHYISSADFPLIVLGLMRSQYPRGTVITRFCKNTMVMNDEKSGFKCNFSGSAKVNLSDLLFPNPKYITNDMWLQLSKVGTGVVSVEEVINYQSLLDKKLKGTKVIPFEDGTGNILTLNLAVPNLVRHTSAGERWIQKLIIKAEEMFTVDDDSYSKNEKVNSVLSTVIGGVYSSVVDSLTITGPDGSSETVSDEAGIDRALNELSRDTAITSKIIDTCYDFIDNAPIAIVGFQVFECPTCKEQNDGVKDMPEIVPFNIVEYFFALSSLNIRFLASRG